MSRGYQVALAALVGLCATAVQADVLIKNVTLYDGTGGPAKTGAYVLVKGDKIAQVSTSAIPPGAHKSSTVRASISCRGSWNHTCTCRAAKPATSLTRTNAS